MRNRTVADDGEVDEHFWAAAAQPFAGNAEFDDVGGMGDIQFCKSSLSLEMLREVD